MIIWEKSGGGCTDMVDDGDGYDEYDVREESVGGGYDRQVCW